jgi:hypothetical protein
MILAARSDGSIDQSAEQFIAAAREALALQTAAHAASWRFGEEDNWAADLEAGTIVFEFFGDTNDTSVGAQIQVVGTYDTLDGSFLWGRDHPSVPEALSQHARLSKAWGEKSGVPAFTTRKLHCTEDEAWSLAAVTACLANANGVYRGPAGSALVFFTFGEVKVEADDA